MGCVGTIYRALKARFLCLREGPTWTCFPISFTLVYKEAQQYHPFKKLYNKIFLKTSRKSLQFLRGEHYDVNEELNEMIERRREKEAKATTSVNSWTWMFRRLASPAYFRPFVCLGFIKIIMQWGGNNIIMIYMVAISLTIFCDDFSRKKNYNALLDHGR